MNKILTLLGAAGTSVLLSACSLNQINQPSPEVNYHLLDHNSQAIKLTDTTTQVALNNIKMVDYLVQPNLVMRTKDNKLNLATYHLWAEPLDKASKRVVIESLNQLNQNIAFVNSCENCQQIDMQINHFYPNEFGEVVLRGSFELQHSQDKSDIHYFNFVQQQSKAGYSQSVIVMNQLLLRLSEKINEVLAQ